MEMQAILKLLREKNNLTQEQMAERLDGHQAGGQPLGEWGDAAEHGNAETAIP